MNNIKFIVNIIFHNGYNNPTLRQCLWQFPPQKFPPLTANIQETVKILKAKQQKNLATFRETALTPSP